MNATPRLSVGLPVYNGEKYIAEAIDSLLGQTFEDFELIISDNASTDRTSDICRGYAEQDSRVRYLRQPKNIGLSRNHNFVVEQARGEFFKWAAADDLYARDLFERCLAALDKYPDVVLVHAWTAAADGAGNVTQAYEYPLKTDSPSAPERFRSFMFGSSGLFEDPSGHGLIRVDNQGILRACDEYGVIRTDVLRGISPHASYHHQDRIVVTELLLRGPFFQVRDWLYFRRDHEDRAYKTSLRARCEILDPRRASRLRHPAVRLVAEYLLGYVTAIRRAPISAWDKRQCYLILTHWMLDRATSSVLPRRLEPLDGRIAAVNHSHEVSTRVVVSGQEVDQARFE